MSTPGHGKPTHEKTYFLLGATSERWIRTPRRDPWNGARTPLEQTMLDLRRISIGKLLSRLGYPRGCCVTEQVLTMERIDSGDSMQNMYTPCRTVSNWARLWCCDWCAPSGTHREIERCTIPAPETHDE